MKSLSLFLYAAALSLSLGGCAPASISEAKAPASQSSTARPNQPSDSTVPDTTGTIGELEALEVHFIDVGQGDATLIRCGQSSMLIDAGENDQGALVRDYLKNQGVESLDYLVITHPDSDHCGGADIILGKYDVGTVIYSPTDKDTATWEDVENAMRYADLSPTTPKPGATYELGDASFTIVGPVRDDYEDGNDASVSLLLSHGENRFLFTGDAGEAAEQDMLAEPISLSADVLKVAHHGSRTATSIEFLEAVNPSFAVISCGESNEYGHPHAATLNALRAHGTKLYRTDEQGSLIAASDGSKITWNAAPSDTWKAGEPTGSAAQTSAKNESKKPVQNAAQAPVPAPSLNKAPQTDSQNERALSYVLNTKTKKFHLPECSSLPTTNRSDSALSREELLGQGYSPCKRCNP